MAAATLMMAGLGGCGADAPPAQPVVHDAAMQAALDAPLLVDPGLSQMNAANLAIVPPRPVSAPQPVPTAATR